MTTSTANLDPTKLELSPMRVTYKGVDLGGTLNNLSINFVYGKAPLTSDQLGPSKLDQRVTHLDITITTSLAEIRDKEKWKIALPHAKLITVGPNQSMLFDTQVGDSDLARAGILLLHPLSLPDADKSQDYKFFLATATAESEITYSAEEQSKLTLIWQVYPDFSTSPARYAFFGDEAVGQVDAIAGAAVPDGGNTGDGTVGSITVFSGVTVTETVTLTCVTAVVNGGTFHVSGSISAGMGLATVGVGFTADDNEIAFTIADGAADFIVGDSFTIATTAANYI